MLERKFKHECVNLSAGLDKVISQGWGAEMKQREVRPEETSGSEG